MVKIRHHVGHEPLVAGHVFACDDRGLQHARVRQEGRLDLAELYAKATDLDLMIKPAKKFQLAVRAPAHKIAGSIKPLAGRERVRNEALGCQGWSKPISPS